MKHISDSVKKAVSDSLSASGVDDALTKKVLAHLSKDGLPSVMNRTKTAFLTVSENLQSYSVPRDKDAPRARLSAYNLFGNDVRAKKVTVKDFDVKHTNAKVCKALLTKINTDAAYKMALQDVAQLWPSIATEVRAKYQAASVKDKERFDNEMTTYVPATSSFRELTTLPKAPAKSAMDLWIREQSDATPEESRTAWKDKWSALSDEARSDATIHFAKKNMEFLELKQLFHESFPEESALLKRKQEMMAGAPSKPKSAYLCFSIMQRDAVMEKMKAGGEVDLSLPNVSKHVATAWLALDAASKKPFEKKAEEDKERYHREVELYEKGEWTSLKLQDQQKRHNLQSAAVFFVRAQKKQWKAEGKHADTDGKTIHLSAVSEWKGLSPEQQSTWVDKWKTSFASALSILDVSNVPEDSEETREAEEQKSKKSKVTAQKMK